MAINKNHEFEELEGVKCSIVEKNATPERVEFLKNLLEYNRYTVIVIPSPPPKVVPPPPPLKVTPPAVNINVSTDVPVKPAEAEPANKPEETVPVHTTPVPAAPQTFTVGVTDYTFNSVNAIFGRLLKTQHGQVVTQAYWQQNESVSHEEIPYYENKNSGQRRS